MDSGTLHPRSPGSSASALANRSIRHRGLSPKIPGESECQLPYLSEHVDDAAHIEATDGASLRPIMLPRMETCDPSPLLPFSELDTNQLPEIRESTSPSENALYAVPLTPLPGLNGRTKSNSMTTMSLPRMSHPPSPDLSAAPRASYANIFDYFKISVSVSRPRSTRMDPVASDIRSSATGRYVAGFRDASASSFEFLRSVRMPSMKRLKSHIRVPTLYSSNIVNRPQHPRSQSASTSNSSRSSSSARTYASTSSVDSGRTYIFSGINTTDRFTHRWPKPMNLKKLERRDSTRAGGDLQSLTSEELNSGSFNVGLGFEHYGRWTTHKWCLLLSVSSVLGYSIAALVYSIFTWYQTWDHADVMLVADGDVLILATLCASLLLLAALVGLTGTLLNSRPLLAIYAILLWPALVSLLSIGYISYKRSAFSLDRKLNLAWSQWYTDAGRAVIQDSLRCCGFTDPTHEAFYGPGIGGGCFPRSLRPGCKGTLLRFERENLGSLWRAAFSAAPLHIVNIIVCLLCVNHVNRTFGTGLIPRGYRLRVADVRADAHRLLEHFTHDRDGAARLPPPMARTGSGTGWRRDDKVYAHGHTSERFRSGDSSLRRVNY